MRVVVTGVNGLLGGACASAAMRLGWSVLGIDRSGGRRWLSGWSGDGAAASMVDDLMDPFAIHRALDLAESRFGGGVDAIVHLANHANARSSSADAVLRENLGVNASVFVAGVERGVGRIVFASSIQAFVGGVDGGAGEAEGTKPSRFPIDETTEARPTNAYGLSKLLSEGMLCRLTSGGVGLTGGVRGGGSGPGVCGTIGVSVRLPYLLTDESFAWVRERASRGEFARTEYRFGGPEAFAWLHVDDAAAALMRASDAGVGLEGYSLVWACSEEPRAWEGAGELVERFYSDVPGSSEAARRGSFQDVSRARSLLGWRAERSLLAEREAGRACGSGGLGDGV